MAVETLFNGLDDDCELNYLGPLVGLLWTYIADSVKVCQGLNSSCWVERLMQDS